jgi:hypothetical protein
MKRELPVQRVIMAHNEYVIAANISLCSVNLIMLTM